MYRCLFLVLLALAGIAITYRGRKFSWHAFGLVLFVDAIMCMSFTDYMTIPEIWQIGAVAAIVIGLFAQIFMAIWFQTAPPACQKCGHIGRLNQRRESF